MAVVVGEFEVVPQAAQPAQQQPPAPEPPRAPGGDEIERILSTLRERELRLRAD